MKWLVWFGILMATSGLSVWGADATSQIAPLSPELRDRCIEVLTRGFRSIDEKPENFWPAMHAAEALTVAGRGADVIETLRAKLGTDPDHQHRCGLARELVRARQRDPLKVLFDTLGNTQSNGRVHAAESLYKVAELNDGRLMLAAFEQTENERLQLMAAAALGRAGHAGAMARLRKALASEDREVRKIGAWVLGLLGDQQDIEPLKKLLNDEDELARAYVVNALACLGDAAAREQLGKNLKSSNPAVRTYSADFAGYARVVEHRQRLIEMLSDENLDARIRAAQGLVMLSLPPKKYASPDNWPQFRGINASGVSRSYKPLPTTFSTTENMKWSIKLGDGIGCPIVVDGNVFVTGMTGEQTFSVFSFVATTGAKRWQQDFPTGKLPRITPPNSHASSTPASDGRRVYAYFSTLGIVALDIATGEVLWKRPLPAPNYLMDWGAASSPIVHGDTVYFNQDDDLSPVLFGIDATTGSIRWKADRPDMLAGYAVPVVCEAQGRTDVVISGSGHLKGYDPSTGAERWTCNSTLRTMMTSPVVRDDVIYLSSQSYGDETRTLKYALLEWLDTNQDGTLARAEIPKEFWTRFDQSDKNKDGFIAGPELDTAFQSANNQVGGGNTIQAVRGGGTGDVTKSHVLWNIKNKSPSNLVSPLVVGEQLFLVKKGGLSSSFNAANGASHWELSRIRNIGDYYASPIAGDGKIYVTGENGFVVVLEQGSKLKILATNDVGESCLATPALSDGRLFVRGRESLFCFGVE